MQTGIKRRFSFVLAAILVLVTVATCGLTVNADTNSIVFDSFDEENTGPKVTNIPTWDITTNTDGTLEVVEFPDSNNKSLRATNSDTGTTQKTQVSVKRKFASMTGKVYLETKVMYKDVANTNSGNFNICLWGCTSGTTTPKTAVQFQRFSGGNFGYMLYSNSLNKEVSYSMPSSSFIFPKDEWVTLKMIVNTQTQKADLSICCDALKNYNGTVDPQCSLDKATGTCTVSGINFYTEGMQFDYFNQYSFALNKYACEYNFDYFKIANVDEQAPTIPSNLAETGKTATTVSMAWDASSDNVGVTGYEVYRNGELIATVTETNYTAAGLATGIQYTFTVRARDEQGNVSPDSSGLIVTTILDKTLLIDKCAAAKVILTAAGQGQEGIQDGMYVAGTLENIIYTLQKSIDDAQAVIDNTEATAVDVDISIKALDNAIERNSNGIITASTGDLNDNGSISIGDLGIAARLYGKNVADADWQSAIKADFNQDGTVEASDLEFLSRRILMKN